MANLFQIKGNVKHGKESDDIKLANEFDMLVENNLRFPCTIDLRTIYRVDSEEFDSKQDIRTFNSKEELRNAIEVELAKSSEVGFVRRQKITAIRKSLPKEYALYDEMTQEYDFSAWTKEAFAQEYALINAITDLNEFNKFFNHKKSELSSLSKYSKSVFRDLLGKIGSPDFSLDEILEFKKVLVYCYSNISKNF